MPVKTRIERLKETITLLKKLPQVGVPRESYAYSQVQDLMTTWVNGAAASSHLIDFESHIGTLVLPDKEDTVSSLDLKAKCFISKS
jgi:hypothetical protein